MDSLLGVSKSCHSGQLPGSRPEKQHEVSVFSKPVRTVPQETYTHIELGAGNYRYGDKGRTEYTPCEDKTKVHAMKCTCDGCSFEKNRYRYSVLESTIHHVVTENKQPIKRFLLNDIDYVSLDQAVKHAKGYIEKNFQSLVQQISIEALPGDFYKIRLSEFKPASIHLKNPDQYFFTDAKHCFESTTENLLKESDICEYGGFVLVTTKVNSSKLQTIFKSQAKKAVIEPYELPYHACYHSPQYTISDIWHENPFAYLCKPMPTTT